MKRLRSRAVMAAAVLALGLWPGESAAQRKPKGGAGASCGVMLVSSPEANGGAYGQSFSATGIADLELHVLVPREAVGQVGDLRGEHVAGVRVLTPRGHLYQELLVPMTADAIPAGVERAVAGYPHPMGVARLEMVRHGGREYLRVTLRLPVAGSAIVASGLYGLWSAEAYIDHRRVDCIPSATFRITP